jgi:hypothetical protein
VTNYSYPEVKPKWLQFTFSQRIVQLDFVKFSIIINILIVLKFLIMDYLQQFPNYFKDLKAKWMQLFDKIVSKPNKNPLKISKCVLSSMNAPEIMLINALHWINEEKRINCES